MKIFFFGGTFDPPHKAHKLMYKHCLGLCDKFIFFPCKQSPLKNEPFSSDVDRLKMLELLIDSILGVKESAVIGIENKDLGETVVAVIVLDRLELTENDILLDLKNKLANYKLPRKIIFIPELPRNTMGKVQKQSLRKVFSDICI